MGKLSNVLNALAIGIGGVGEGYGKGMLEVAMKSRDEVHARLREERAAAREAAATASNREFQKEQTESDRGFKREMFGEEMAWEKEKFGLQEASEEKKLRLAASLRPKGEGDSGIKSTITDETGKVWALTKHGQKIDIGIKQRVPASAAENKVNAQQLFAMRQQGMTDFYKEIQNMNVPREEASKVVNERVNAELDSMGVDYPGKKAKPASENPQESVSEVEQPGVVDAPATAAKGPTDAAPRGAGTERSPYLAETEEELKWVLKNGGKGVRWVEYKGQIIKTKGEP